VQVTAPSQLPAGLPGGFGSQDDRIVSQWNPVPQSASVVQKPPSVHVPLEAEPAFGSVAQ
jgi:hypothetical protein